jgi:hypothetical protein
MKTSTKKKKPAPTVAPVIAAKDFFASELRTVMQKRHVEAQRDSFDYLVELLTRFIETNVFYSSAPDGKMMDHFLVGLYGEYVQGSPEVKRKALQRLGDVCLMVTGFFPDSLNRKIVDIDYYSGMGGNAYGQLAVWQQSSKVFQELSVKFRTFSNVLGEMSERSGLQSNTDLLRLYERWVHSKSDRLKEILAEKGIETPVLVEVKTRH